MKEVSIISKVVSRGKAEALPSASASMPNWAELAKYVTIDGDETIHGVKDFANGLMIGGLPLIKLQDDVVYLDAHLVVRGGITMFGTGEDVDVPTIMDALSVDGVNLQVINGVLTFVGEATGGVADSVRWENVIGRPTLLSSFTDDVVAGKYLPLSGGTISSTENLPITISNNINDGEFQVGIRLLNPNKTNTNGNTNGTAQFGYSRSNGVYMFNYDNYNYYNCAIGITDDGIAYVGKGGSIGTKYKIWHEGNHGSGSGLSADMLDGYHWYDFYRSYIEGINAADVNTFVNTKHTGTYSINHNGQYSGLLLSFNRGAGSVSSIELIAPHYDFHIYGLQARIAIDNNRYSALRTFAFTDSNVASATKLQTARTIWGQSFDGTENVDGAITIGKNLGTDAAIKFSNGEFIDGYANIVIPSENSVWSVMSGSRGKLLSVGANGCVGVNKAIDTPLFKLDINGNTRVQNGDLVIYKINKGDKVYPGIAFDTYYEPSALLWQATIATDYYGNGACAVGGFTHGMYFKSGRKGFDNFIFLDADGNPIARISGSNTGMNHHFFGDFLATGGITMYSDQRKKTILNHVELSLKQIADAPLIEHYYNSDESKTTHVGSIAQYWAEMNDWFCKLDNEGFYTMEIQNAALASAISIARELQKYESKTDKKIRLLKKRIGELEDKIEELEKKGA